MTDRSAVTRRGALALTGSALLSGCSAIDGLLGGEQTVTLDGPALQDALSSDVPTVPNTLPVDLGEQFFTAARERAREFRDDVPAPLGPEEIPNGAIRAEVTWPYDHAAEHLESAADASRATDRWEDLTWARAHARNAAASWQAIDGDLTRDAIVEDAEEAMDDLDVFEARREYVGSDPVVATLVHAEIEDTVENGRHGLDIDPASRRFRDSNPLGVGEAAEDLERGLAATEYASTLYDSYVEGLDEQREMESTIDAVGEQFVSEFLDNEQTQASGLEERIEDGDLEETALGVALWDLYDDLHRYEKGRFSGTRDAPAQRILAVVRGFAELRAFDALRERAADYEPPTTVDDVAAMRTSAVEGIETALAETDDPTLAGPLLTRLAGVLEEVDAQVDTGGETVELSWLYRDLGYYVRVGAVAREVAPVSERVAEALRSA